MNARTRAAVRVLRDTLQYDLTLARRLVEVAHALSRALVDADPERVAQLQAVADTVSERQESNDQRRLAAARSLADAVGIGVGSEERAPSLLHIARALPGAEARPVVEIRERILGLHLELTAINERNRRLIENLRAATCFTMEALVSAASRPATYGPAGPSKAPTVFIDQAA